MNLGTMFAHGMAQQGDPMNLQTRILADYREVYPNHTLREISRKTEIQLTRIFRLLNGAPMKLAEYERFHELIHACKAGESQQDSFQRTANAMRKTFNRKKMDEAARLLERRLRWQQLIYGDEATITQNNLTA